MLKSLERLRKIYSNFFDQGNQRYPDAIILGVQKAATSSLFYYLNDFPNIKGAKNKEIHYFDYDYNYCKGVEWYKKQFPKVDTNTLLIEASPSYFYYKNVPERIYKLDTKIKFIVVFRNPIERAYSAWNMQKKLWETDRNNYRKRIKKLSSNDNKMYDLFSENSPFPSFREMLNYELNLIKSNSLIFEPSLIRRGFYVTQLRNWFNFFDKSEFLFLKMEDFHKDGGIAKNLNIVLEFLGIHHSIDIVGDFKDLQKKNKGSYSDSIDNLLSENLKEELKSLFKDKNRELSDLTRLRFSWL